VSPQGHPLGVHSGPNDLRSAKSSRSRVETPVPVAASPYWRICQLSSYAAQAVRQARVLADYDIHDAEKQKRNIKT
jgi:hypothetical protein